MKFRKKLAIVVGLSIVGIGVGAFAYASIPGPDGVIHGCVKTSNGALIAIDSSASCPSGFTALNWNQTGPAGANGTNGVSGYEVVVSNPTIANDGSSNGPTANCPAGKHVFGGGYNAPALTAPNDPGFIVFGSTPAQANVNGASLDAWQVNVVNNSTHSYSILVYAICAEAN